MNKTFQRLSEPGTGIYILLLTVFAAASLFYKHYELAIAEGAVVCLLIILSAFVKRSREKKLKAYIESITYETENAKSSTLMNFPLPIAVFRLENSRIVWGNDKFFELCGLQGKRMDACISDFVPQFSGKWLSEGKVRYPGLLEVNGRKYQLHGNLIRSENEEESTSFMGITYWLDVTEYDDIRIEYENSRPAAAVVVLDNLEELIRNLSERQKNDLRDEIDEKLKKWSEENRAIIERYQRDRYILVMEQRTLDGLKETKFPLLEEIRRVESPSGMDATLSIGIGEGASDLNEALQFASVAAELALSRGGDQVVIKDRLNFQFFGGRGSEVEKRTKVKSRVVANTLAEIVRDSSRVLIMGHKFADLDSVGAAAGACCLARKCGVKANIVLDMVNNSSHALVAMLRREPEYRDVFISAQDALIRADGHTLLIVVDTNRPEQVEYQELLEMCNRVAVIDHHRMAATYIRNAALSFLEPFASSASELMSEILQEVAEEADILKCEADAMLSGIVLDTKSFTVRTGDRTFDAAAYLRRCGADTVDVKKLMQTDMGDTVARYSIMQNARLYKGVAIAAEQGQRNRVIAAQAADELLNISGVDASVVIVADGKGGVNMSARSIGELNVQLVMEKLGGGGNKSVAACQIPDISVTDANERLLGAIDEYMGG